MKRKKALIILGWSFFVLLITFFLSLCCCHASTEPAGTIIDFREKVTIIKTDGTSEKKICANRPLYPGETVKTGTRGWAAILMADETLVQLSRDTEFQLKEVAPSAGWFRLRKIAYDPGNEAQHSSYRLKGGRLWLRNNNKKVSLEIQTPTVSAGIRGTEMDIRVEPNQEVFITVVAGNILVWNDREAVHAVARDFIAAKPGVPIKKTRLLTPKDAVQWTVTLPDFLKTRKRTFNSAVSRHKFQESVRLLEASESWLEKGEMEQAIRVAKEGRARFPGYAPLELHLAYLMILKKELREAFELLEKSLEKWPGNGHAFALHALAALLREDKKVAMASAMRATGLSPNSDFAWLVQSLVHQSHFKLDKAVEAVEKAISIDGENSDAFILLARLQFGSGLLDAAHRSIKKARSLSPERAEFLSLEGFILLAVQKTEESVQAFEKSIRHFPGYGEAHMGLAIAHMREEKVAEAMEEIAKASLLAPQRSLFVSYFGKMLYQIGRLNKSLEVLEHASLLDPRDPTPHLYQAIIHYDRNRPTQALEELQLAMSLNDNQAVFRSRFLLDRDVAVNHVDQSVVFNELGLSEWARSQALDSVKLDYSSAPAHIFLAGAYNAMEGRAKAGATEILLSLLMAPANVNSLNTYNRYTSFFEKPDVTGALSGYLGEDDSGGNLIVSANLPRANLAFDAITTYDDSDGWRGSDYQRTKGINAKLKWDPTPRDGFLVNLSSSFLKNGDQNHVRYEYDAWPHPDDWTENRTRYLTLGYHRNLGQYRDLFLVYKRQETDHDFFTRSLFFLDESQLFLVDQTTTLLSQLPYDKVQGQCLTRMGNHQIITGGLWFWRDKEAFVSNLDEYYYFVEDAYYYVDDFSESSLNRMREHYQSYYIQDIWRASPGITVEAALYYDNARRGNIFSLQDWREESINPRLGVIWKPGKKNTVRLGLFSYYVSPVWQRLDPPDIAGIPVFRNTYEGTRSREADLTWERKWEKGFFSVNLFGLNSRVDEKSTDGIMETWKSSLGGVETVWNQIIGDGMGIRATCRFREIDNDNAPEKDRREYMATAALKYQHPRGLFGGCAQTFRHDRFEGREPDSEEIWITDLQVGYEFPDKRGLFTINVANLFDRHFNWVADDFVFTGGRVPVRKVTVFLSLFF